MLRSSLLTILSCVAPLLAQPVQHRVAPTTENVAQLVPDQYLVTFEKRTVDLEAYRTAILAGRSAAEVEFEVQRLQLWAERDQAGFAQAVRAAGGAVTHHFWIINGAAVTLPMANAAGFLAGLPNVASVTQDRIWAPWLETATDAFHHGGDLANQITVNGQLVQGQNQTIAILDTGMDANMGGTGRPHAAFYPNGDTTQNVGGIGGSYLKGQFDASGTWGTEDRHGHGTFVAGCAAANKWVPGLRTSDYGFARQSFLYNINVSSNAGGGATGAALVAAWQHVAQVRVAQGITVANNSYSGSPSYSDPVQQALDSVAANSDVLVIVAAGNSAGDTSRSQSAYNGISVGAIQKNTLALTNFSCRGPLFGTQRTYPDIAAVGESVNSVLIDVETSVSTGDGTSFAAPMVAGAGALVRQARPTLTALQTKALLLNTTMVTASNRNQFGLGLMRADGAVTASAAGEVTTVRLTSAAPLKHLRLTTSGSPESVTACWNKSPTGLPENIDLNLYTASGNPIAQDLNPENSYEKAGFQPGGPGVYRATVRLAVPGVGKTFDVAVAGHVEAMGPPIANTLTPSSVNAYQPADVIVDGVDLDFTRGVTVGGQAATYTTLSPTQIRVTPPNGIMIGTYPVVITTEVGVSPPLQLTVTGTHPAVLTGPVQIPRGTTGNFTVYGDRNWISLIMFSTSDWPSILPGIVDLEIGNGFLSLWQIGTIVHDSQGVATFGAPIPASFPIRPLHFFEIITVDPANPVFPLETSNAHAWRAQ